MDYKKQLLKFKLILFLPFLTVPAQIILLLICRTRLSGHLITFSCFILIPAFILFLYYRNVYSPVLYLIKNIESFRRELPSFVDPNRHFLSAYICRFIDERIMKVVNEEYETKLLNRQAIIHSLQSQINPHFLYNTLDSVRGKALEQHNTELADMVEALAIYFRYSISDKNNIITLREELKNLDNYIKIQTFRFGDRFIMEKSYEETDDLLSQKIPKMTLQPLVENSLNHGIDSYPTGGVIKIYIETTDQHLFIHVMDNGQGMKPEQLAKINNSLQNGQSPTQIPDKSSGLALVNVDNRIKLYFGAQYGLHIYSTPNVGTDVEVVLPVSQSS